MTKKQSFKKFFALIACWFVAIITIIGGSMIYDNNRSSDFDASAAQYINKVVPEISEWTPTAIRPLLAAEVNAAISDEQFLQSMERFSHLGKLQEMSAPKLIDVHENHQTSNGQQTIVEYDVKAKYSNGDAVINLKLLPKNTSFEIYRFNFSSELLRE